ncbi:MAG: SCO family protein [Taibaiella sp.]|nr:SCO family protein [Taibaiella sp.]
MKKNKNTIILLSFFIILSAIFMGYYYKVNQETRRILPVLGNPGHHVGNFSFINQDGKTITNADVKGKICVVEYFFATCRGICPKMNEHMVKVYQAFRGNNHILILSHTVDPKKDTVQALKTYSLKYDADAKQWMFLTGDKKALYNMARYDYLVTAVDDTTNVDIQSDFIHTKYWVLVDGNGEVRGSYDGTNIGQVNQLIGDIKELQKEEEHEKH